MGMEDDCEGEPFGEGNLGPYLNTDPGHCNHGDGTAARFERRVAFL